MQTQDEVEGLHNCREFSQPLEWLYQAMQTQEKSFLLLFVKYLSKLIRQMKGILFIDFLIQKEFLNTRSRQ